MVGSSDCVGAWPWHLAQKVPAPLKKVHFAQTSSRRISQMMRPSVCREVDLVMTATEMTPCHLSLVGYLHELPLSALQSALPPSLAPSSAPPLAPVGVLEAQRHAGRWQTLRAVLQTQALTFPALPQRACEMTLTATAVWAPVALLPWMLLGLSRVAGNADFATEELLPSPAFATEVVEAEVVALVRDEPLVLSPGACQKAPRCRRSGMSQECRAMAGSP